jgi:N-acetyl-anhydromuramyl-L-alanine amidase AmpD
MPQRLAYVVAAILILAQAGPASAAPPSSLQSAFAAAASEFRVPGNVLLAVSYVVSRWETDTRPSAAAGYGPMQLLDASSAPASDGKGADRKASTSTSVSGLRGIAAASSASGVSAAQIKTSATQNIRAGAALLATYARDTVGATPADAGQWYGAVAKYSSSDEASVALGFADDVFAVMKKGAARTTSTGETVTLAATKTSPDASTAGSLALLDRKHTSFDCPKTVQCRFIPAAYHQNSKEPGDYGNFDLARRESDGLAVRFVVIHDAETDYHTTIKIFQEPLNYVSANYVVRSSDGQITQMVDNKNVAWHAGNWNVNMHAIGYEHEGFAIQGTTWYTEAMYQASAALTKHLAAEYGIPLDRAHIIGHDDIPGPTAGFVRGMHWDPGPFWNWARYMALLGAPIAATATGGNVVTIAPDFATNMPQVRDCEGAGALLAAQPANFVYLYTSPSLTAPLFNDPGLASSTHTRGTDCAADWGDKADTGQTFYRVQRQGDWDRLYYAGNTVWFYDPGETKIAHTNASVITPKAGATSIPVYGAAYPESISSATLTMYSILAGQKYVAYEKVKGDYYEATTFNDLDSYVLHTTPSDFYMIQFNHRLAFVKASDVDVSTP